MSVFHVQCEEIRSRKYIACRAKPLFPHVYLVGDSIDMLNLRILISVANPCVFSLLLYLFTNMFKAV